MADTTFGGATMQTEMRPTIKDWSKVLQLIDTTPLLNDIDHVIKQEIQMKDDPTKWYTPQGIKPLMNEEGRIRVLGIVKSSINKTIGQSNFDDKRYKAIVADIWRAINDDLFKSDFDYSLSDQDKQYIIDLTVITVKNFLTQAINDKSRKYIFGEEKSHRWEQFIVPRKNEKEKGSIVE